MTDAEIRLGCIEIAEKIALRGQYDPQGIVSIAEKLYAFIVQSNPSRGVGRPRKDTP
jgi:hypothetical protein